LSFETHLTLSDTPNIRAKPQIKSVAMNEPFLCPSELLDREAEERARRQIRQIQSLKEWFKTNTILRPKPAPVIALDLRKANWHSLSQEIRDMIVAFHPFHQTFILD
jgi:hypothetical protein